MTHWRQLYENKFWGSWDFAEKDQNLTIRELKIADVPDRDGSGRTTAMPCLFFKAYNKPMVLSKTNGKMLERLFGPKPEEWAGKTVTFYRDKTKVKGNLEDCIRIRPSLPKVEAAPPPKPAVHPKPTQAALVDPMADSMPPLPDEVK